VAECPAFFLLISSFVLVMILLQMFFIQTCLCNHLQCFETAGCWKGHPAWKKSCHSKPWRFSFGGFWDLDYPGVITGKIGWLIKSKSQLIVSNVCAC